MDGRYTVKAYGRGAWEPVSHVVQISKVRMNPYVRLLQQALCELGIECSVADGLSPRLVRSWRGEASPSLRGAVDVLHLHWLELLYASPHLVRSMHLWVTVLLGLGWAKSGRCKVVYTVHNLSPHEQSFPILDRVANRALFSLADALHVHDKEAALDLARNYGRRERIYVIPHGSYIGAYPNQCTRQEARERLGLPRRAFVYLVLGQIRRYKGIEDLVAVFGQLADEMSQLLIAGNVHDPQYGAELARLTQGKQGIRTWFEYVPDNDVQYFMNACDVCVLPYRDVTTSGAAVLAFSFGKPIIAPALSGFSELAANGRAIIYSPEDNDGLRGALHQARSEDMAEAGRKALIWAREHQWRALAPRFAGMYRDVSQAGS